MSKLASTAPFSTHAGTWRLAAGWITAAGVIAAPVAAVAAVNSGQIVCYADRPCIELASVQDDGIRVEWRASGSHDFFNVKWSRPGKDEDKIKVDGGYSGSLALTKILPETRYVIQVQGCDGQLWGGPVCTEWEVQEITTGAGVASITPETTSSPLPNRGEATVSPANPSNNVVVPTKPDVRPSNAPAGSISPVRSEPTKTPSSP